MGTREKTVAKLLGAVVPSQVGEALAAVTVSAWHGDCLKGWDLWVIRPALEWPAIPEGELHHTPSAQIFFIL